jgi:hypothetical protein
MMKQLRYTFVALFAFLVIIFHAQAQFMTDINGRVVQEFSYTDVEGSPYFLDGEWYSGTIRAMKGQVFDGVRLRFDAYKNEVEYTRDNKLYRLGPEVLEFTIPTGSELCQFRRGFPAVGSLSEQTFYRVLHDGVTKLLKYHEKKMREEKAYNSATTTKRFETTERLYILKDGTMTLVRRGDRKGIMALLADKRDLMEYTIKEQQLNLKEEEDITKLLEEYDAYKAGKKG